MLSFIKKIKYFKHYALWAFMFVFVFDYHFWEGNWGEAVCYTSVEVFLYVLIFYFNFKFAIPSLLEKKKYLGYICSLLVFLIIYIFFIKKSGIETHLYEGELLRNLFSMTINFTLFWLISTLYWYFEKLQKEREQQLLMRAEKLEAEIKFLKNQISPHFIFNTLNNIYSLVLQGHKNAAPMLAKLSDVLRYLLYDSSQETVFLGKELSAIQKYIELQLLRKPKSENVDFYREGKDSKLKIVPLILLNFVENCFKHSDLDKSKDAWIKISCIVKENNLLHFSTKNSKKGFIASLKDSGLGNTNIQRQLELNYPNAHELNIEDKGDFFVTHLIIKLPI
ncbi:MAG: hypothetical protein GY705_20105 [Bacteroidetes bacterium]|nr:hypothetical protein [Bacteroidota bacterium]